MKKYYFVLQIFIFLSLRGFSQNVGIGNSSPIYKLDVNGIFHTANNAYVDGLLGVGTTNPSYKLQVNNGPIALFNTTDLKAWYFNYSTSGLFYLSESGLTRLVVANGGNVGIGTTAPAAKLDVAGDGNVSGNLTVSGNKGIIRNAAGNAQLRYYTRTASFTAILPAFGTSAEGSIGFSGFTNPPQVMVGDIVSTGGTVGELFRVQLVIYDVTATGCHCRLINTSSGPVNYGITWNIICVGN
jgi:hypothetical protein